MNEHEKKILEEANAINKRLEEERLLKKKEDKEKKQKEKQDRAKQIKQENAIKNKIKAEKLKKRKEAFESTYLPEFQNNIEIVRSEIDKYEKLLDNEKNKKRKLQEDLMPHCVHKYGKSYSPRYSGCTYVDCEYCGYSDLIHEVCF